MSPRSTGTSPSRAEELFRAATLLAVAAVPCAFLPYWREYFVIPKVALAGLASLLAAAGLAGAGRLRLAASRIDAPLAVFAAVVLAASASSVDPWLSWFGQDKRFTFGAPGLAAVLSGFYLGCALRRDLGEEAASLGLSRSLCAGSLLVSSLALLQRFDWVRLPIWGEGSAHHVPISTIGNNASLGLYLAMALPAAWSLCRRAGPDRVLGAAAFFLAACGLGVAGSRSAAVAALCGAAAYRWAAGSGGEERGQGGRPSLLLPAAVVCGVLLLAATLVLRSTLGQSFRSGSRWEVWRIAVQVFLAQPWLGSGPGTFGVGYHLRQSEPLAFLNFDNAHNDWLEVLATTGVVGTAAYLWLHAAAFKGALQSRREGAAPALAPIFAAVCVFFLYVKLNPPNIGLLWIAAVLAGTSLAVAPGTAGSGTVPAGPVLLAVGALWLCVCSVRGLAADLSYKRACDARWEGKIPESDRLFAAASWWRPEVGAYRFEHCNMLWFASDHAGDPEARRALLLRAVDVSREGLRRRPLDAELHRLLGRAEYMRWKAGETGRLVPARAALESSLRLDPFHKFALADLAEVARLQGDLATERDIKALLARVSARHPIGI